MPEVLPVEINTHRYGNVIYLPNPQHRDGNLNKSQWSISIVDEIGVFHEMTRKDWSIENSGWGLYFRNGALNYLGIIQNRNEAVFIAKFVVDSNHNAWHGYPANLCTRQFS